MFVRMKYECTTSACGIEGCIHALEPCHQARVCSQSANAILKVIESCPRSLLGPAEIDSLKGKGLHDARTELSPYLKLNDQGSFRYDDEN